MHCVQNYNVINRNETTIVSNNFFSRSFMFCFCLKEELKKMKEEKSSNSSNSDRHSIANNSGTASSLQSYEYDVPNKIQESLGDQQGNYSVIRVYQRIKFERDDTVPYNYNSQNQENDNDSNDKGNDNDNGNVHTNETSPTKIDMWALIEYEITVSEDTSAGGQFGAPTLRFARWRRFHSESAFSDHIRRDSGEPINVPPYSLSPKQSQLIEEEARQAVTHVTEEFRRFRVRAEVARKQADATVRLLQSNNVQNAQRHIEGQDVASELAQARTDHNQLAELKTEMAEQEAHWKSAYDVLLAENNQLKSSGSEALLAAQWRQRFESCLSEKEKLETILAVEKEKSGNSLLLKKKEDSGKYEAKYKDLKESFRLYRKKAKEIFEAQQKGETTVSTKCREEMMIKLLDHNFLG